MQCCAGAIMTERSIVSSRSASTSSGSRRLMYACKHRPACVSRLDTVQHSLGRSFARGGFLQPEGSSHQPVRPEPPSIALPAPQVRQYTFRLPICTRVSDYYYTACLSTALKGDQTPLTLCSTLWTGCLTFFNFAPLLSFNKVIFCSICPGVRLRTQMVFSLPFK